MLCSAGQAGVQTARRYEVLATGGGRAGRRPLPLRTPTAQPAPKSSAADSRTVTRAGASLDLHRRGTFLPAGHSAAPELGGAGHAAGRHELVDATYDRQAARARRPSCDVNALRPRPRSRRRGRARADLADDRQARRPRRRPEPATDHCELPGASRGRSRTGGRDTTLPTTTYSMPLTPEGPCGPWGPRGPGPLLPAGPCGPAGPWGHPAAPASEPQMKSSLVRRPRPWTSAP